MAPSIPSVIFLVLAFAVLQRLRSWIHRRKANPSGLPYPPGPRPLPLLGNLLDVPSSHYWLTYADWAKKYGDINHINVFGKHVVVLNSIEACTDLLEKRSAKYSDRPRLPMVNELMGFEWAFVLMPYGSLWREHRKMFHQHFYPNAAAAYVPQQIAGARKTLLRIAERPEEFRDHIRLYFAASILNIIYGIKVDEKTNREFVHSGEMAMQGMAIAGIPGTFLVDILPILKHLPAWFPGAGFKSVATYYRHFVFKMNDDPAEFVKKEMASHPESVHDSFLATHYHRLSDGINVDDAEYRLAKNTAGVAFAGGADTTVSSLLAFFLAMKMYPEVMAKAQAQIDEVVGRDRLPEFADVENMPYIQAIVKELFRWHPVTPLAIAHMASEDDEYRGYYIPKGAVVFGNSWAILHNEKTYPEPEVFRPERFLNEDGSINPDVPDPIVSFGFGRRICPGRHLATNGALIMVASILAVFNIGVPTGEDPVDNTFRGEQVVTSGLISFPLPFSCSIKLRSPELMALLHNS